MTDSTPKLIPVFRRTDLYGYAIVDADDYERLKDRSWYMDKNGYIVCKQRNLTGSAYMHRIIAQPEEGQVVDHINHNRSDNRKANLRGCTVAQNSANTRRFRGKHGYRGISVDPRGKGKWRATMMVEGIRFAMGSYATPEEAAKAYDSAARQLQGDFAILNFPDVEAFPGVDWVTQLQVKKKAWGNRAVTEVQMRTIREERAKGRHVDDLAAEFGLNRSTVYRIIKGVGYQ